MKGLKCPKCGKNAPECGGIYLKQFSHKENGMRYFNFPVYMCDDDDCEFEFLIIGARFDDEKNEFVYQDPDIKREDYDGAVDWDE